MTTPVPQITEVCLFTNRQVMVFDQAGNQINNLQADLSSTESYNDYKLQSALEEVIQAEATCYIARWNGWRAPLSIEELAYLLGQGTWYWETIKKPEWEAKQATEEPEDVSAEESL